MRTLTESSGKRPRIIEKLVLQWKPICAFAELLSIAYLMVLMLPDYNERTRISENALLPALVQEHFAYPERINAFLKALPQQRDTSEFVRKQLETYGIETYVQSFDVRLSGYNISGNNIYGVVRSGRSPSVESILVGVSLDEENSYAAIATTLALATHCREQLYWARDLIFVFVERSTIGMRAFLDAYHAHPNRLIIAQPLQTHSGAIIGAFIIKVSGYSFSTLNIDFNMLNGQLPNLDLINLIVRLADKFTVVPTLFDRAQQSSSWPATAEIALMGAYAQAFESGTSLHSVFSLYAIQGVSIHAKSNDEDEHISLLHFTRICEGILRSLNNILEKFHQSYFLYVLPSPRRFVSVAYYMPSIGILLFPLIILALREWFTMMQFCLSNSYALLHLIGIIAYIIATTIALSAQSISVYSVPVSLLLFIFPYYIFMPLCDKFQASTRFIFYIEYCLIFGSIALLNFSMALIVSLISMPLILAFVLLTVNSRRAKHLKTLFGFVTHPLVLFMLCESVIFGFDTITMENTLRTVDNLLRSHLLLDSFTYPFIFIVILPLWNIFMQISTC